MVETAVEAAAMAEAVEAAKAMGVVEAVVWDTVETATRKTRIVIEEQPQEMEVSQTAAQAVAAEDIHTYM